MQTAWPAVVLPLAALWAAGGLVWHVRRSLAPGTRGTRRPSPAAPQGRGGDGIRYMFTTGMRPSHKESVARHPVAFVLGLSLHAAVATALAWLALHGIAPVLAGAGIVRIAALAITASGVAAALALAAHRAADPALRALSVPEDYVAEALVAVLLALTAAATMRRVPATPAAIAAALLLFWIPIGKLRHMATFFVARADLGRRLGERGTFAPARAPIAPVRLPRDSR